MTINRIAYFTMAVTGLLYASGLGFAQTATTTPPHVPLQKAIGQAKDAKPEVVPSLIVLNARGASLQGQKLTLVGVAPNSIVFADRPVRSAGHVLTAHLLEEWGTGSDSFAKDPPNATVSVFSKDGSTIRDAVVVLKTPNLAGDQLTFDVQVLEGDLAGADGPASVFIDIIGMPWTPLSFAGVARRSAARAAWYGAAAAPYYHPYYPPGPILSPPLRVLPLPALLLAWLATASSATMTGKIVASTQAGRGYRSTSIEIRNTARDCPPRGHESRDADLKVSRLLTVNFSSSCVSLYRC